jgi:hypothetical protein
MLKPVFVLVQEDLDKSHQQRIEDHVDPKDITRHHFRACHWEPVLPLHILRVRPVLVSSGVSETKQ